MASPTPDSALPIRLAAWASERFPMANAVLFLVLYIAAVAFGRALTTEGPVRLDLMDGAGFFAAWSFFLMLRVFDEHKDYELDCQNHPQRVLQSGRVSLGHLKLLGIAAIVCQAGSSLWLDEGLGLVSRSWAVVMLWSALMAREFFVGPWLEKRLVLYALSHMLVMPMAMVWMAQVGAGDQRLPAAVGLLAALSFLSGAAFEVTRKSRGADEERPTVASYSQVLGPGGAAATVFGLLAVGTLLLGAMIQQTLGDHSSPGWFLALAALLLLPGASLLRYGRGPTEGARKLNEALVGLNMLASYGLLVAATVVARGLTWS